MKGWFDVSYKIVIVCWSVLIQAREEAIARGEDPDVAEAMILNGGAPAPAAVEEQPEPQPKTGLEGGGLGISTEVGRPYHVSCSTL